MTFDRSLENYGRINESLVTILERLAAGGFLTNNRQWFVGYEWTRGPWLSQMIRSLSNLEKVYLDFNLTLTEDLPQLFQSCLNLTDLYIRSFDPNPVEHEWFEQMNEKLINELRLAFQRLRLLELWKIDLCSAMQEIFTQVQRRQIEKKTKIGKF